MSIRHRDHAQEGLATLRLGLFPLFSHPAKPQVVVRRHVSRWAGSIVPANKDSRRPVNMSDSIYTDIKEHKAVSHG